MTVTPVEIDVEFTPRARFDVIDVTDRIPGPFREELARRRRALYCSYHTTAGFLEQSLCARLHHNRDGLLSFVDTFRKLFPPDADYRHDDLTLRSELSEAQRQSEPRNADSHLAFIGSGLKACVTYTTDRDIPVYFIDLDGTNGTACRQRQTTVIGFNREEAIDRIRMTVPVSNHAIDSVNLKDPVLGLFEQLEDRVRRLGIEKGRIDVSLDPQEHHVSLTVNEYETLLMKHDLAEVLRNPLRFVAEGSRRLIDDPRAIPSKALNYAKYDLVQILNQLLDSLGMSGSVLERLVDKFLAVPARRRLQMKRAVSLTVSDRGGNGRAHIVQGPHQSPILVQWGKAEGQARRIEVTFVRLA